MLWVCGRVNFRLKHLNSVSSELGAGQHAHQIQVGSTTLALVIRLEAILAAQWKKYNLQLKAIEGCI